MPAALISDIRERVIKKRKANKEFPEISEELDISISSAKRIWKLAKETGSIVPKANGGGGDRRS